MAQTVHEEVLESEDLLNEYHGQRANWATQAMEDDEFRNNIQWTSKKDTQR